MPIDFKARQLEEERKLNDLLAQSDQGPARSIENVRASHGRTQDYLGSAAPRAFQQFGLDPSYSGSVRQSFAPKLRSLDSDAREMIAKNGLQSQRSRFNLVYDTAVKMAQQYGLSYEQSVQFAQQKALDDQRRAFEAGQGVAEREINGRLSGLQGYYTGKGLEVDAKYGEPLTSPGEALTRVLAGTAASVGTAYAMNRRRNSGSGVYVQPQYDPTEFRR